MKLPVLKKFLENPSYLDNTKYGFRWSEKRMYEERWEYMKKEFKSFDITYFKESNESYYLYIEYPSELRGNTYDIVIHFIAGDDYIANESSLMNYNIQIFSNNPVFGFHFAHANYTKGLLIPFLAEKFSRDMIENKAVKYNPDNAVGYCHSFYQAGMYLIENQRLLNKTLIDSKCLAFDPMRIFKMCRHIDTTIEQYNTIKSRSKNLQKFGKEKSIGDTIDDVLSSAKEKLGKARTVINKTADKITGAKSSSKKGVHKTTPKKSITTSGKSSVRHIKPKKKI